MFLNKLTGKPVAYKKSFRKTKQLPLEGAGFGDTLKCCDCLETYANSIDHDVGRCNCKNPDGSRRLVKK